MFVSTDYPVLAKMSASIKRFKELNDLIETCCYESRSSVNHAIVWKILKRESDIDKILPKILSLTSQDKSLIDINSLKNQLTNFRKECQTRITDSIHNNWDYFENKFPSIFYIPLKMGTYAAMDKDSKQLNDQPSTSVGQQPDKLIKTSGVHKNIPAQPVLSVYAASSKYFPNTLTDYTGNLAIFEQSQMEIITFTESLIEEISQFARKKLVTLVNQRFFSKLYSHQYCGIAGVAYMFWHISKSKILGGQRNPNMKERWLYLAENIWVKCNAKNINQLQSTFSVRSSLFNGLAGWHLLGALIASSSKQQEVIGQNVNEFRKTVRAVIDYTSRSNFTNCLMMGRAGILCGALNFQQKLNVTALDERMIHSICSDMIRDGHAQDSVVVGRSLANIPLLYDHYGQAYLGAFNGVSSILQMLISFPSFLTSEPQAALHIRRSIDGLLLLQKPDGNFVKTVADLKSRSEANEDLVQWCHGAPGVIYLFAKAYKVWGDQRYLEACIKCGEITWQKGLSMKGCGLCHGIAGNGYVFLLLYRLTNDEKHLHRAFQFAKFAMTEEFWTKSREPDNPFSLFEGKAGLVCFLSDLLQPEEAAFPFFDVL